MYQYFYIHRRTIIICYLLFSISQNLAKIKNNLLKKRNFLNSHVCYILQSLKILKGQNYIIKYNL
jgi:hypothetical protein